MSTAAGASPNGTTTKTDVKSPDGKDKGKGKNVVTSPDVSMEEEDDDDEDEDEDDEEGDEEGDMYDDDEEEASEEEAINPEVILGRRTRGVKVDYTSEEALKKAGLKPEAEGDDEDEDMK